MTKKNALKSVNYLALTTYMIRTVIFIGIMFSCVNLFAQETAIYRDADEAYKQGMTFYEQGFFGQAQQAFRYIIEAENTTPDATHTHAYTTRARLYGALCAIRLQHPEGERLALDFIRANEPSDIADIAKLELADFYYNEREYKKAIAYLEGINEQTLDSEQIIERTFKLGYSYFVRKKFERAREEFAQIISIDGEYFYPGNYYYGVTAFFEDDYDEALVSFELVEESKQYKKVVPYYIAQIYFAKGRYDELIGYATPLSQTPSIKYNLELNKLIGNAWFEKGDYQRALPFLQKYNEQSATITEKDVYQLAYTQYQLNDFGQAIRNFEELRSIDSPLGQNALYNLADSYLQTGDKTTARNVFLQASKMNYDPEIQQICNFNFAKISYDLGHDRDAIRVLQNISPVSANYDEARRLLSDIFLYSRDYEQALELLEKIPAKTPDLKETYQKVAYYRGVQLYNDIRLEEARTMFYRSMKNATNDKYTALAMYWLGEMSYFERDYNEAISTFDKFINLAQYQANMPDEASIHTASYNIAYSYLKRENYENAARYFQDAVNGLRLNLNYTKDEYVREHVLPDATLRAADSYFKTNNYPKAIEYYDDAIEYQYEDYHYAMYQRAVILGLRNPNDPAEGILALEELYKKHPKSDYADDAIFKIGVTYLNNRNLRESTTAFERLINRYPESDYVNRALLRLGLIHINQGENNIALQKYKRIFTNNPNSQEAKSALKGIEEVYISQNDPQGYINFKNNLPGYEVTENEQENILFKNAETHFENGSYARAASAYENFLQTYPKSTSALTAYFRRAESYFEVKNYDKAYADYTAIIGKGNSRYLESATARAALIAYNHKKDFANAFKWYQQLMEFATTDESRYNAHFGAVRSAYRANLLNQHRTLATTLRQNDRLTKRERAEVAYYIAKSAFAANENDVALQYFNDVINLTDDQRAAEARYRIAYIYYLQRDLDFAQEIAFNANREIASYPYWLGKNVILLGDIFVEKKDYFNARASLESIVENYTKDDEVLKEAKAKLATLDQLESRESRVVPDAQSPDENLEMEDGGGK